MSILDLPPNYMQRHLERFGVVILEGGTDPKDRVVGFDCEGTPFDMTSIEFARALYHETIKRLPKPIQLAHRKPLEPEPPTKCPRCGVVLIAPKTCHGLFDVGSELVCAKCCRETKEIRMRMEARSARG